jgi:uncharacterized protein (TIGR00730 family)
MTDQSDPPVQRSRSIPKPPHPSRRRRALPNRTPKPQEDDAQAPAALRAILESSAYREADQDLDFLQGDQSRGVRLELDYLKTETLLQAHGIAHTIVVFGSTRICEPQAASRALEACKSGLASRPRHRRLQRELEIAERIADKSRYYEIARTFGRLVGAAGKHAIGGQLTVVTGGGPGIMEAANRGAHDVGAKSIGLNITLPHEQYPNPYVTPELCFRFHYFAMRKLHFLLRACALVAFPGGFGTLDELFEVLALTQTRKMPPVPIILIGESYWRRVFDPDFLVDEGVIDPEDRDLFWYAETAEQAWQDIVEWHQTMGHPLVPA